MRREVLSWSSVVLVSLVMIGCGDGSQRAGTSATSAASPEGAPGDHVVSAEVRRQVAHELRQGGSILYFRHAQREKWDSVIAFDVWEVATGSDSRNETFRDAVCLTPQGVEEAIMIGKILELGQVPVGAVWASPSCRAKQTAELAFGRIDTLSSGLAHTPVVNPSNEQAFKEELRRVLTTVPIEPGHNAVIVAHGNTLENNADLFASGAGLVQKGLILETGFWVIRRDQDGSLRVVARYNSLGQFASAAIDLDPTLPAGSLIGTPVASNG